MTRWTVIAGPNFSGRSARLGEMLMGAPNVRRPFFVGPYAETGLSGFTTTVKDEHRFYGLAEIASTPWENRLSQKRTQSVSTLSGGEQVMLALSCLSARNGSVLAAIDGALEQLDYANRMIALQWLDRHPADLSILLVDHRFSENDLPGADQIACGRENGEFRLRVASAVRDTMLPCDAPRIDLKNLCFSYPRQPYVFEDCSLSLKPGCVYRLSGENGSGKSTLLKLLCGVLRPSKGGIELSGSPYVPYRTGNRLFAYAMQNPDEQWTSPTLLGDIKTRLTMARRVPFGGAVPELSNPDRFNQLVEGMGISLDDGKHLLDYPRALRKRLTWIWPLSGNRPWLVFDEPTLGQDNEAVGQLVDALNIATKRGHGVIIVSHDERLVALMPHQEILIKSRKVSICDNLIH
jgi:ABC-type Mn2+/Zn2+ transport system ATPase subunit